MSGQRNKYTNTSTRNDEDGIQTWTHKEEQVRLNIQTRFGTSDNISKVSTANDFYFSNT